MLVHRPHPLPSSRCGTMLMPMFSSTARRKHRAKPVRYAATEASSKARHCILLGDASQWGRGGEGEGVGAG